jgi:hypothetical protein
MGKFAFRFCISSASTLIVFVLLGTSLFVALKKGIGFDQWAVGGTTLEKFHIRLDKKLVVDIGDITIAAEKKRQREAFDLTRIRKAMMYADLTGRWFESISIGKLSINDTIASFVYSGNGSGSLTVNDPDFTLDTGLAFSESQLSLDIKQFKSIKYRSQASGKIRMDIDQKKVVADILVDLAGSLPLTLHCEGDRDQLHFEGSGTAIVHTIRPVVELFALGPDIQPWITDYLKGSSFQLSSIKGTIPYNAPANVFQTLYGKASVQDTEYSFEQKLPSIKAPATDVVFENGVLKIYPHRPTYAGIDAGTSWLDINFNPDEPVLSAYIRTKAPLEDGILSLLDFYEIHLPFKQTQGLTDADLTLKINLVKLVVTADGNFSVAKGAFEHDKQTYTVTNSVVSLVDDEVTIKDVNIGFQDILRMKAEGKLKVTSRKADLKIAVEKFDLPLEDTKLTLDNTERQLLLNYHWNPDGETLSASESSWKMGKLSAKAKGFTASFQAADFSGTLPGTQVSVSPYTQFLLSGDFNLKKPDFNLAVDLQGWESDGLKLDQAHFPVTLLLGKNLQVSSDKESGWLIKGKKVQIAPFKLNYATKKITVNQAGLRFGSILDGAIRGKFDISTGKGSFILDNLKIGTEDKDRMDFSGRNLQAEVAMKDDSMTVAIPELGLSYKRSEASGWLLHIEELGKLYDHSVFMQRYNLMKGSIDIWGTSDNPPYLFSGNITSPYGFLVKDNIPLNDYSFKGQYDGVSWVTTINDVVHLHYSDTIKITSNGVGYNFSAFRDFFTDHPSTKKEGEETSIPDLDMKADNSSFYLNPFQSAPIDGLRLHSDGGKLTGQLIYRQGKAELEMNSTNFTLLGQDFDEEFLKRILKDSKLIGGKLSFYLSGLLTKFRGVMKIEDSVIKEGAIWNNIFTFVNTVPDLVSFSLPEYSFRGLPFKQMYAGFLYDNHIIDVNIFALESNAIDMTGTGVVNFKENTIKMNIDLVSKMKQNISKIPLFGYLLVGDKKQPTITLDVQGALDDPDVNTSVYKEIVKTPFDILLRTISLPAHWLKQLESLGDEKNP